MKRIIQFFAVCLGLSVFQTASCFGAETIRNATKRDSNSVVSTTNSSSRSNNSTKQKTENNRAEKSRTTTTRNNQTNVQNRTNSQNRTSSATVKQRAALPATTKRIATVARTTTPTRSVETRNQTKKTGLSRNATSPKPATRTSVSRAAELNDTKIADIKSKDYSKCKSVFYECMDEFCANKDANLGRCACSARIHEFDNIKKQLSKAEDKMLDFNQQLLLVGLDKEDAAAVNVASEGELGYATKDSSTSEKLLQKITKSLNSSSESKITDNLSSVSLSLDMDSAWDSIDSLSGISTSAKTGLDLYNAAKPVCIEMANEVCSNDELDIAQNSYKLLIQQDCNTVAKSYSTQYNQAMDKIHESGALLDMARLNAYQQRNSDDILTCKRKILEQLSDSSVCGEDLQKCLDITGQYINPQNGNAFLSTNLYNLTTLLTAPQGRETWTRVPGNEQFVSFFNSKKMFLEPAIEQCQDISDIVWKDFLDDALSQIKLAQNAKLEEIRQSCTTLVAECKSGAHQDLQDFDARALSTFEVMADSTVNALCADVEQSCVSLLDASGGGATEWESGITGIAADISYDSILANCTTVGRDCIIQQCNGTSGNFALCESFSSYPRRAILTRNACWNEVLTCVQQSTNLNNIKTDILTNRDEYYTGIYGDDVDFTNMPSFCNNGDISCLLTEQIWGNCGNKVSDTIISTNAKLRSKFNILFAENKILIPKETSETTTLLSWLASNTGTTDNIDSCSAYKCPVNYKYDDISGTCLQLIPNDDPSCASTNAFCQTSNGYPIMTTDEKIYITNNITNYCQGGRNSKDRYGNCCASGAISDGICVPDSSYNALFIQDAYCDTSLDLAEAPVYYCADYKKEERTVGDQTKTVYVATDNKKLSFYCITTREFVFVDDGGVLDCPGYLVLIDQYGNYITPATITSHGENTSYTPLPGPSMTYNGTCRYSFDGTQSQWGWGGCTDVPGQVPKDNQFMILYR